MVTLALAAWSPFIIAIVLEQRAGSAGRAGGGVQQPTGTAGAPPPGGTTTSSGTATSAVPDDLTTAGAGATVGQEIYIWRGFPKPPVGLGFADRKWTIPAGPRTMTAGPIVAVCRTSVPVVDGVQIGQALDPASVGDVAATFTEEREGAKLRGANPDPGAVNSAWEQGAKHARARLYAYGWQIDTSVLPDYHVPTPQEQNAGTAGGTGAAVAENAWDFLGETTSAVIEGVIGGLLS